MSVSATRRNSKGDAWVMGQAGATCYCQCSLNGCVSEDWQG